MLMDRPVPDGWPRWRDPDCQHPEELRVPDGAGWICADCGKVAWRW